MINDDPRLKITEGIDGDWVLIGFPHHIGAKREQVKIGSDHAPDCLRRFLPKIGPLFNSEYSKDISKQTLSDYGNIHIQEDSTLEELLVKLKTKVQIVKNKSHIPIVIGGSKDCSYGCLQENITLISIIPQPDLGFAYDGNKCSIDSTLTAYFNSNQTLKNIVYFSIDSRKLSLHYQEQIAKHNIQFIPIQEIRRIEFQRSKDINQPNTQAGCRFHQLLHQLPNDANIHLSISLEAIDSSNCPGVSRPNVLGLSSEEIIEIAYLAANDKRLVSVDITEFNPSIEDYRSGFLLGNIIYYLMLGKGEQLQLQS